MPITGVHALLYSPEADALRALLKEVLPGNLVGEDEGWPIYALPPAELGIHPGEQPAHELSLMCDDLAATRAELEAKGVVFAGEAHDEGWGVAVTMVLPGGVEVLLYEPRHPTAI